MSHTLRPNHLHTLKPKSTFDIEKFKFYYSKPAKLEAPKSSTQTARLIHLDVEITSRTSSGPSEPRSRESFLWRGLALAFHGMTVVGYGPMAQMGDFRHFDRSQRPIERCFFLSHMPNCKRNTLVYNAVFNLVIYYYYASFPRIFLPIILSREGSLPTGVWTTKRKHLRLTAYLSVRHISVRRISVRHISIGAPNYTSLGSWSAWAVWQARGFMSQEGTKSVLTDSPKATSESFCLRFSKEVLVFPPPMCCAFPCTFGTKARGSEVIGWPSMPDSPSYQATKLCTP